MGIDVSQSGIKLIGVTRDGFWNYRHQVYGPTNTTNLSEHLIDWPGYLWCVEGGEPFNAVLPETIPTDDTFTPESFHNLVLIPESLSSALGQDFDRLFSDFLFLNQQGIGMCAFVENYHLDVYVPDSMHRFGLPRNNVVLLYGLRQRFRGVGLPFPGYTGGPF